MQRSTRLDATFTATLAAALVALCVTVFASMATAPAAEPALHATLPAVTVIGKRPTLEAELARPLTATARSEGSIARDAS